MIYSIKQHKEVPVCVEKKVYKYYTRYFVNEASKPSENIGYVDLEDSKNGVMVHYIENLEPKKYKHFGIVADQIELEHCLNRGIDKPYIQSEAKVGTLIKHFKRGKRFIDEGVNIYLEHILSEIQKGERIFTGALGNQKMYMPINYINELKSKIKINPLLKGIK